MEKINILVTPNDRAGSGKYRCLDPHLNLQKTCGDDFIVDINYNVDYNDIAMLKRYQIIYIQKLPQAVQLPLMVNTIINLKKLGLKVIVDIDDYWSLDPSHGEYHSTIKQKVPQTIIECLRVADAVVTPSHFLLDTIKKSINKNVFFLPNAIDPLEPQFIPKPTESELIRFGWLGGSSHILDIELFRSLGKRFTTLHDKIQFVLCGFDTNGIVKKWDETTKQFSTRQMTPTETVWYKYEQIITNNHTNIVNDRSYISYLDKFEYDPLYDDSNKVYRRIWTKPINTYAQNYNIFDVALAPLNKSTFNMFKSNLKVVEAGFHKKALVAQDYGAYTKDLIPIVNSNGTFNEKGNSMLIDVHKNHKQWSNVVKMLCNNPNMIKDMSQNLYELVFEKYNLNNVTKTRSQIYKQLL